MGWQDRSYYRDSSQGANNPLLWLLTGSVPLFTAFGIRVRMHASLLLLIVLVLLFGLGQGFTWQDRLESMGITAVPVPVSGYENSLKIRPHHLELWLSANAFGGPRN